jgi:hypothetical protein
LAVPRTHDLERLFELAAEAGWPSPPGVADSAWLTPWGRSVSLRRGRRGARPRGGARCYRRRDPMGGANDRHLVAARIDQAVLVTRRARPVARGGEQHRRQRSHATDHPSRPSQGKLSRAGWAPGPRAAPFPSQILHLPHNRGNAANLAGSAPSNSSLRPRLGRRGSARPAGLQGGFAACNCSNSPA